MQCQILDFDRGTKPNFYIANKCVLSIHPYSFIRAHNATRLTLDWFRRRIQIHSSTHDLFYPRTSFSLWLLLFLHKFQSGLRSSFPFLIFSNLRAANGLEVMHPKIFNFFRILQQSFLSLTLVCFTCRVLVLFTHQIFLMNLGRVLVLFTHQIKVHRIG